MTSSLVGLGDVYKRQLFVGHLRAEHGGAFIMNWRGFAIAEVWNSSKPVSYTHLTLPTICSV
eukprot:5907975-Prorocentrum_lima.AAC.1